MSLHHRTENPVLRAHHIADRLEQQHENECFERNGERPGDWPRFWLDSFNEALKELSTNPATQERQKGEG